MDLAEYDDGTKVAELDVSLNDMLSAFNKMLRRKKLNKPLHTRITTQEISIDQRMDSVLEKLNLQVNHRLRFDELFEEQTKEQLVVTFLALLELMKRKLVEVEQAESFADLYVQGKGKKYREQRRTIRRIRVCFLLQEMRDFQRNN